MDRAILAVPTLDDFWITCATDMLPPGCASRMVRSAIVRVPDAVWITVSGVTLPASRARATVSGLAVEPGSNRSVITRLRSWAPVSLPRLFGL